MVVLGDAEKWRRTGGKNCGLGNYVECGGVRSTMEVK